MEGLAGLVRAMIEMTCALEVCVDVLYVCLAGLVRAMIEMTCALEVRCCPLYVTVTVFVFTCACVRVCV